MLVGYMRVSKADGSQTLELQRDALLAAGVGTATSTTTTHPDAPAAAYVGRAYEAVGCSSAPLLRTSPSS
jgi:hypothetical protein